MLDMHIKTRAAGRATNVTGGNGTCAGFRGALQCARGQQGGRLDLSAWAGRHLPPLEKGVHMLGQCVGPHSERRRRRFRRFRRRGAAAAGCGCSGGGSSRLSQNSPHTLIHDTPFSRIFVRLDFFVNPNSVDRYMYTIAVQKEFQNVTLQYIVNRE